MLEVQSVVKKLKSRKAPGSDNIYPSLLRCGGKHVTLSLLVLFNRSWSTGEIPQMWREANICPLPKVTPPSRASHFRPISLLSVVGKLLESLIQDRLNSFVEPRNLIPSYQAGSRPGRSTIDHLLTVQQTVHSAFSKRESVVFVKLDMEKAYDKVWRAGLMDRLRSIGVGGRMYTWVRSFLRGRRARVVLNGVFSSWKQYLSGVPQGSPLSPLLFNIFVTPMLHRVSTDRIMYADDVGLMSSGANLTTTSNQLSRALIKVESWETRYKASFRLDKCYVLLFTRRQSSPDPVVSLRDIHLRSRVHFCI
jgi:hypothetical protein